MSVSTQSIPSAMGKSAAVPTDLIWRLSVDQYHKMIRGGILTEDDAVELPKKRLYALVGIPISWIVNVLENQFEVYTDPSGPAEPPDYRQHQNYGLSDLIPLMIEGQESGRLAVSEMLPG